MAKRALLFALGLVISVALGRALTLPDSSLALFWPAAGVITWWALIARSRRELILIALVITLVFPPIYLATGIGLAATPLFVVANVVIAIGTRILADLFAQTFQGKVPEASQDSPHSAQLESPLDVCRIFVAALPAVAVSTVFGMAGSMVNGSPVNLEAAISWLFRNMTGVIVVGGAGLALTNRRAVRQWPSFLEIAALFVFTLALTAFVFGFGDRLPLAYALIFPLFWSGLRMPIPVVGVHALLGAVVTVAAVVFINGDPFGSQTDQGGLALSVQALITVGTGLGLVVATAMHERGNLIATLRGSEHEAHGQARRAQRLFADAPQGVAVLSTDGTILQANLALARLLGRPVTAVTGTRLEDYSADSCETLRTHLNEARDEPEALAQTDWTICGRHDQVCRVSITSRLLPGLDDAADTLLVHVVDVSERHHYEKQLAHLAEHDALTGLGNRRRFERELDAHLERARRYGQCGALLLIDLDNFKDINDTLGHDAGDELLVAIGGLLMRSLRASDVVARVGGDEFAIILPNASSEDAETVARGIVERIRAYTSELGSVTRRVTASVGVATFDGTKEQAEVMALADMLMYDAKEAGRNRYAALEPQAGGTTRMGTRLEWKHRLEHALEHNLFVLYLQPILHIESGEIRNAEALVRLADGPELILPGKFVGLAEQTGLAVALDLWVIRNGVALLAELRQTDPTFRLSLNISGSSMGDPVVEETIIDSLQEYGVEPSALVLEVTETSAVSDMVAAGDFAERMRGVGTRLALDDFGAGFGSFYYLKHLAFDYVKIDGEFIAQLDSSAVDRSIMRSIAGIARDLGKSTVAEFVGSPEVLEIVRAEGVEYAQGHLVGKPVTMDEYASTYLRTNPGPPPGTRRTEPEGRKEVSRSA